MLFPLPKVGVHEHDESNVVLGSALRTNPHKVFPLIWPLLGVLRALDDLGVVARLDREDGHPFRRLSHYLSSGCSDMSWSTWSANQLWVPSHSSKSKVFISALVQQIDVQQTGHHKTNHPGGSSSVSAFT